MRNKIILGWHISVSYFIKNDSAKLSQLKAIEKIPIAITSLKCNEVVANVHE